MSLPRSEDLLLPDNQTLPPARRRRQSRGLAPNLEGDRAEFLRNLSSRVTPSLGFYLNLLLSGVLVGAAILMDAPGWYLLGVLFTPFLGPVIGLSLSGVVGSGRFFLRSIGSLIIGGLIIFGSGASSGVLSGVLPVKPSLTQTTLHSVFSWADFIVLAVGTILATIIVVRSPRPKPQAVNVAIAYELLLPLAVAGFGLTSGNPELALDGIMVFTVHLAWAVLVSSITFFLLGLRPMTLFGYTLLTSVGIIGLTAAVVIFGLGTAKTADIAIAPTATPTRTQTATITPLPPPTTTPTATVPTPTPTETLIPSATPTQTVTPKPTPVWARIDSPTGGGALIRSEPAGIIISSILNGSPVVVIDGPVRSEDGSIWVKIETETDMVGWILQNLLLIATPSASW
jgi:uncharacterized membrane protein